MAKSPELCLSRNGTVCAIGLASILLRGNFFSQNGCKNWKWSNGVETDNQLLCSGLSFPTYCLTSLLNECFRKKKFWLSVYDNFNHDINFIFCDLKKSSFCWWWLGHGGNVICVFSPNMQMKRSGSTSLETSIIFHSAQNEGRDPVVKNKLRNFPSFLTSISLSVSV